MHHGIETVSRSRFFQDHCHKNEERDSHKSEFVHRSPRLGCHHEEGIGPPGKIEEDYRYPTQHKGKGKADDQKKDK
jgi:hypothetical protein